MFLIFYYCWKVLAPLDKGAVSWWDTLFLFMFGWANRGLIIIIIIIIIYIYYNYNRTDTESSKSCIYIIYIYTRGKRVVTGWQSRDHPLSVGFLLSVAVRPRLEHLKDTQKEHFYGLTCLGYHGILSINKRYYYCLISVQFYCFDVYILQ